MQPRYAPRDRAEAIIRKIDAGELRTPGAWADLIWHIDRLPPRLAAWTWKEIEDRIGPDAVRYLQHFAQQEREVVPIACR
jgi:hypothetical protein